MRYTEWRLRKQADGSGAYEREKWRDMSDESLKRLSRPGVTSSCVPP